MFIGSLAGNLLAAPLTAEGQQPGRVARIGYLAANLAVADPRTREAFLQGLRDLGYVEGRNLLIEYRDAAGKTERFPALAAELVALKVDVIVAAGGTLAALAAKQATTTCGPGGQEPASDGVLIQVLCRSRGPHVLWTGPCRLVSARRDLRGQDSQGRQARRPARRATHEVRLRDQLEDRQGARLDDPAVALTARGSDH